MIIPVLQVRKRIAHDYTINHVARSEGPETSGTREQGSWRGRVCRSWEERLQDQRLQCRPLLLDGAGGSACRTHLALQPTSSEQAAGFMRRFIVRRAGD